ncbi:hypothetical protein SanaruYs_22140 [Chryseotalea sanaruensis]|uniref:Carboxypeptidase-like regulatory domain-containing protein n=1 Tax=Chryseotalea sanaruensis TaxID=2482724 RepID=A0A401UAP9_9BACT|nr:DUF5686 and carboxypeptidase regulatory-like domain-containing protein [Chryseotalea sanaruensis]GCC51983.1 hypothetical protein SanaruYs_22140 [Chryseotalea sanaruensis]
MLCLSLNSLGQSISGSITDENNQPVPYATIFIRELNSGTTTNMQGKYFMLMNTGIYHVAVSCVGYESQAFVITVADSELIKNIKLQTSSTQLNELVIRASRRDPAFEIIQSVIDNKEKHLTQVKSYKTNIYVRALEQSDKKKKSTQQNPADEISKIDPTKDPLEEARKQEEARLMQINLVEMQLTLNYKYPDNYKEERTAYKLYGSKAGLYIPIFSQADFNFYHNLVDMKGISEIPLISPISRTAILSYKYKLDAVLKENEKVVYKIKVIPRKSGDATVNGFLYVNDSTWNINRLEFTIEKGGLKFYDLFIIKQNYEEISEGWWIPTRQEFTYETKASERIFKGKTILAYSNYEKDVAFPERFFGNEVSVITKDAYKKDSSYWNQARPEALSADEKKLIALRDSIEAVRSSKRYIDSINAKFNKVTIGEVLYHGVGFRNGNKKSSVNIASLLSLIDFAVVGGFRLGPYGSYFRRYENDRTLWINGSVNVGFKNKDIQGNVNAWWRHDPYHLGDLGGFVGRSFYTIYPFDAYLNQLKIANYILHEHADIFYRRELFNGFYVRSQWGFANRKPIDSLNATSIIDDIYEQGDPLIFNNYQAFISNTTISYTPGQQYMTEPTRKVVLGSKYPTFTFNHKKGWDYIFGSDVDFDYIEFSVQQNLLLGTLGDSRYTFQAGRFVNTKELPDIDIKRFRQADPVLYSEPLHSFQLLDTSLTTTNWFLEAHYIHHFNGAMINNIPLIKKTKIRTVAGAGAMWIQESNFRHQEIFGGLERIFKLGPRRRLRLGVYGIIGQSNNLKPTSGFKLSFDIIDTWKLDWSY